MATIQESIGGAVTHLTAAVQNAGMYPDSHPLVVNPIREAHEQLSSLLGVRLETTILLLGEHLTVDNRPLSLAGATEASLIRILRKRGLERVTFQRGVSLAQLEAFVRNLSDPDARSVHSMPQIRLGKIKEKEKEAEKEIDDGTGIVSSEVDLDGVVDLDIETPDQLIRHVYQSMTSGKNFDVNRVDELVVHFMDGLRKEANPLKLLSELKSSDEYTFTHTANVGILTMYLAEYVGFKAPYLKNIGVAATLHDIGKITTPDTILMKPGRLTEEERAVMENHTLKGAIYLMNIKGVSNLAVLAAMEHHIKYDGTGYPRLRGNWQTNIVSQMISIADVFDALRTSRPYREPMSQTQIEEILIREKGTSFNPYLVDRFIELVRKSGN
jgi:HD-GYP domain-containing protein (c-di-GMP phosphodiesterase class II)